MKSLLVCYALDQWSVPASVPHLAHKHAVQGSMAALKAFVDVRHRLEEHLEHAKWEEMVVDSQMVERELDHMVKQYSAKRDVVVVAVGPWCTRCDSNCTGR